MTKVTILGEPQGVEPKKKIEFVKSLTYKGEFVNALTEASAYKNVALICINWQEDGLDLMFAFDEDQKNGCLYLGHFNDGVV